MGRLTRQRTARSHPTASAAEVDVATVASRQRAGEALRVQHQRNSAPDPTASRRETAYRQRNEGRPVCGRHPQEFGKRTASTSLGPEPREDQYQQRSEEPDHGNPEPGCFQQRTRHQGHRHRHAVVHPYAALPVQRKATEPTLPPRHEGPEKRGERRAANGVRKSMINRRGLRGQE